MKRADCTERLTGQRLRYYMNLADEALNDSGDLFGVVGALVAILGREQAPLSA